MVRLLIILLMVSSLQIQAQEIIRLHKLEKTDFRSVGSSIIYGNFINRADIEGGFKQEIRLFSLETNKMYSFGVMPPYSSKKSHTFCYNIPQGKYIVINYRYTDASMFGTMTFTESICKADSCRSYVDGQIIIDTAKHYIFDVPVEGVFYTGTWNFKLSDVYFSNDKTKIDKKMSKKYKTINFINAVTVLPQ